MSPSRTSTNPWIFPNLFPLSFERKQFSSPMSSYDTLLLAVLIERLHDAAVFLLPSVLRLCTPAGSFFIHRKNPRVYHEKCLPPQIFDTPQHEMESVAFVRVMGFLSAPLGFLAAVLFFLCSSFLSFSMMAGFRFSHILPVVGIIF